MATSPSTSPLCLSSTCISACSLSVRVLSPHADGDEVNVPHLKRHVALQKRSKRLPES
ncbi:hypothetical protein PF005_g32746 [Phytophthora fragariae]|uniref:Uncharacterized protein n=1 Tax=Phytophthora fragariae TaxID=53985 RepID=A0A6A3V091_9STRA|nr:hypothetical protein PF003_g10812 [Phytophthora fragariae]KAE8918740.1 hypothetical protein PF009_g30947 [Phytophthora fragariae]KAE8952896.1 hypothetical protein PF011_g32565 [Phytophthora fragariae]KAE9062977.1 hypothetical protein PF010_g29179 [Phytophthora fragariae]KAE9078520.1 hypothetical protein PF006_g27701 [Phytophthora fragariae]